MIQAATRVLLLLVIGLSTSLVLAHGVDDNTRLFLQLNDGAQVVPFMYIGAKHMVTGYDHLLFLLGVIFFLYRAKDVFICVSQFTLGHAMTLLYGVLAGVQLNAHLVDALIGFSVFYKGFDNLGGFRHVFGLQPDVRLAVLVFGFCHGFGLATKLQEFYVPDDGLLINLIAFNIGVEVGQFSALALILIGISAWRRSPAYARFGVFANTALMSLGLMLVCCQLTGFVVN